MIFLGLLNPGLAWNYACSTPPFPRPSLRPSDSLCPSVSLRLSTGRTAAIGLKTLRLQSLHMRITPPPDPIRRARLGVSDVWVPEMGFSTASWGVPACGYGADYTEPMLEQANPSPTSPLFSSRSRSPRLLSSHVRVAVISYGETSSNEVVVAGVSRAHRRGCRACLHRPCRRPNPRRRIRRHSRSYNYNSTGPAGPLCPPTAGAVGAAGVCAAGAERATGPRFAGGGCGLCGGGGVSWRRCRCLSRWRALG